MLTKLTTHKHLLLYFLPAFHNVDIIVVIIVVITNDFLERNLLNETINKHTKEKQQMRKAIYILRLVR